MKLNNTLKLAARFNLSTICAHALEHADVNARSDALRIAAESKSYDAFGAMLRLGGLRPQPPTSGGAGVLHGIEAFRGESWKKVVNLSEKDSKVAELIDQYGWRLANSESMPSRNR